MEYLIVIGLIFAVSYGIWKYQSKKDGVSKPKSKDTKRWF